MTEIFEFLVLFLTFFASSSTNTAHRIEKTKNSFFLHRPRSLSRFSTPRATTRPSCALREVSRAKQRRKKPGNLRRAMNHRTMAEALDPREPIAVLLQSSGR
jgi:hypothetical protein